MTQIKTRDRCQWCGRQVVPSPGPGRPRRYCKRSCRQRAYELRRRQGAGRLLSGEIPIPERQFRLVQDELLQLTAALEDVDQDLSGRPSESRYQAAFWHLYNAAERLRGVELYPSS
ncbi:MAG: hypothetical protein ACYCSF_03035 [Acidimicrobiales bacterium]